MPEPIDLKLIHLACDGELTPEQAAAVGQFIASNPEQGRQVQQQIEQQKALQRHVDRIMRSDCPRAPSSLLGAVRSQLEETDHLAATKPQRQVFKFIFSEPRRANVFAVAATLALIAGAVLFGIFGRPIDDRAPTSALDLVSDAALFADQEHRACAGEAGKLALDLMPSNPAETEMILSERLGTRVQVFDLSQAGYQFIGSDQCDMPVPVRSGHLIYRKVVAAGQRAPMLSVFVVPDQGRCRGKLCEGLDPGQWGCVSESGVKCKHKVLRGTDGRLVYFLVCCKDSDLDKVAEHIELASKVPSIR